MKRKPIALLLGLALLAGCGGGSTGVTTKAPAGSTDGTTKQTDGSQSETPTESEGSDFVHSFPIVDETVTFTAVTMAEMVKDGKWNEYWEEATGVHMDWTYWPATDFDTNYSTTLAGGTMPNLFYLSGKDKRTAYDVGKQGKFVDYRDYLEFMPYMQEVAEEFPEVWPTITNEDGSIYGLPQVAMTLTAQPGTIYYRTDMFQEAGIDIPETTEEFAAAVEALQEHFGADNEDFVAFQVYSASHMSHAEHFFFPSFGEAVDPEFGVGADGKVQYNYISDQYKHFLEFMNELYSGSGFDKNIYTEDGTVAKGRILANGAAISTWGTAFGPDNFKGDTYDVDMFAPLTSEYTDKQQYRQPDVVRYGHMNISSETENIDVLVKWLDSLYAKRENAIAEGIWAISPWIGKENVDWRYTDEANGLYEITPPADYTDSATSYINTIGPGNAIGYGNFMGLNTGNIGLQVKGEGTRDKLVPYGVKAYPLSYLDFSDSENRILSDVYADISNHVTTEKAKFISGQRDLAEWDTFVNEIKQMGIDEVLEVHNAAYGRYNAG